MTLYWIIVSDNCAKTMASIVSSSLGDQLNCAVCLERFADPRTLPCHHSFCRRCLRGVPHQQEEDCVLIKCPTCREPSQLPEGGTDQLPKAFLINKLLELQNQVEHNEEVLHVAEYYSYTIGTYYALVSVSSLCRKNYLPRVTHTPDHSSSIAALVRRCSVLCAR